MEGSCEYIEYAVADSLGGGPPAWGLVEGLTTPHRRKETVTKQLIIIKLNPWRYVFEELRPTEAVADRWQYRGPCGQLFPP